MKGRIVPLHHKYALLRNTGPELLRVKGDTVNNIGPFQANWDIWTIELQSKSTLAYIIFPHSCQSSSQMTRSQALLNSHYGRRQTSLDHIPSVVSILPGKLAAELKLAHLFIPEFGYVLVTEPPLFLRFPYPQSLGHCHSSVAAAWSICLGWVGEEEEGRVEPALPCSCS